MIRNKYTGEDFAAKVMKSVEDMDNLEHEIKILNKFKKVDRNDQFGICRIKEVLINSESEGLVMVMDLYKMSLYTWRKRIGPMTIYQLAELAWQLGNSLSFISLLGVHSDLKCENIMVESINPLKVRICDFGSMYFNYVAGTDEITTLNYRCPEVACFKKWGYGLDMWAVGCILVEMYTGKTLFPVNNTMDMLNVWEIVIGPIPLFLRGKKEYFTESGILRPPNNTNVVSRAVPLEDLIKNVHLLKLVRMLLIYDKNHRASPERIMNSSFVRKYRTPI